MKIISFTTIPSRINKIESVIKSLCNQSMMADEIILWIPEYYTRLKSSIDSYPKFLNNYPVQIKHCKHDYGPFTKLRPSLDYCSEDDIIVTCDDDIIYPDKWFENLVNFSYSHPDYAIGYRGRKFINRNTLDYNKSKLIFGNFSQDFERIDIITGTRGALYKKRFFTDYIYSEEHKDMFFVDDIWINGNLAKAGTTRIVIPDPGFPEKETLDLELYSIDSLYEFNEDGKNNNHGINVFKEYF